MKTKDQLNLLISFGVLLISLMGLVVSIIALTVK
ncbi:putative holin-like toxin [Cohnella sp.]